MTRAHVVVLLASLAAGCSGGSEEPGAVLRGPGALAAFDGIVAHESGTFRRYLAVANERGDELRLVDATDNEVVISPGLVFPLSIPSSGRPVFVASVDLGDADPKPDALVMVPAGSSRVELVDTWSGFPAVIGSVDFGSDVEILSLLGARIPGSAGGEARFLAGLSGGMLGVIRVTRNAGDIGVTMALESGGPLAIGFDALSLAQGSAPDLFVYAATRDTLPPTAIQGVAKLVLPADLTGWSAATSRTALDAKAPTERVAVADFSAWDSGTDTFGANVGDRVIAVPSAGSCGEGFAVRCGLLAIDAATGALAAGWGGDAELAPISLPAPIGGLVAVGRKAADVAPPPPPPPLLAGTTLAGSFLTSGLAVFTADDGRIYTVDLARWTLASDTSPLVGASRTQVTSADAQPDPEGKAIGLWGLSGEQLSAEDADLPTRIRVTPGFTPNETWTLAWQSAVPALTSRAAVLRQASGLWLSVQAAGGVEPTAAVRLEAPLVEVGDTVEVLQSTLACAVGMELAVAELAPPAAGFPGGSVRLTPPVGSCLETEPTSGTLEAVVTLRAGGLVLWGANTGLVSRPAPSATPPLVDEELFGPRLFYVTDPCTSAECAANWPGLTFPFPSGAAVALRPGFLDAAGAPSTTGPAPGTRIVFQTASGLVPSARRPIIEGVAVSSALPTGLALVDDGNAGAGAQVYASFTAGLVLSLSTASAPSAMTVIR